MNPVEIFNEQLQASERFRNAFQSVKQSSTRKIQFEGFSYTLQLNPARIRSSKADISKPLAESACFLCKANMPEDQLKVDYDERFFISVNPFPILWNHLTIISKAHTPQTIQGNTSTLLKLAKNMEGMVVFYNSPKSGASAPFHCHFQAGTEQDLPAYVELDEIRKLYTTDEKNGIFKISEPTRRMIVVEDESLSSETQKIDYILDEINRIYGSTEAEANIGAIYKDGRYRTILFPREKHRPYEYSLPGNDRILVSPGFADMAGMIPCSLSENYHSITAENIKSIMNQVSIPDYKLQMIALK